MKINEIENFLSRNQYKWLITGVTGFIGSNLLEKLLSLDQKVFGVDNFSTGTSLNLEDVRNQVGEEKWRNLIFKEVDITNFEDCKKITNNIDFVLHQAALGSVPRSVKHPKGTFDSNILGFANIIEASRKSDVKKFIYASSSSVYGDSEALPKSEINVGNTLSPYAYSKKFNEEYARQYFLNFNFNSIGLRYFNVFGKRQNPSGEYAAVIPKWINSIINNKKIIINGDGSTSRDFCYIENVVQIILLSAFNQVEEGSEIFNVSNGKLTSLNNLLKMIQEIFEENGVKNTLEIEFNEFRKGDILKSQADISKAEKLLKYRPSHNLKEGLTKTIPWFIKNIR